MPVLPPEPNKLVRAPNLVPDDEEEGSFFRRYRVAIGVILVLGVGTVFIIKMIIGAGSAPRRESSLVLVSVPPPPPPPPVQTAPPEQKMEERQTFQPEEHPVEEPPKPPAEPPIGTNIKGDGSSNSFGLGNSGGNGLGGSGSNASRFGWYAGQVQAKISDALRNNRKTRAASLSVRARIWPDADGRVARAQLAGSTGDPELDRAIRDEVLTGLRLTQGPPPGMPLPLVLQLTAKRPLN